MQDDKPKEPTPRPGRRRAWAIAVIAAFAGAVAGVAAVYGIGTGGDKQTAACAADPKIREAVNAAAKGEIAALVVPQTPAAIPDLAFEDGSGAKRSLADFRGKVTLVNLWATWCAPCRKEMPSLEKLEASLGGKDFSVVAIAVDSKGVDKAKKFLGEIGVEKLPFYADPSGRAFQDLKSVGRAMGLPTTLVLDRNGCEIAYLPGPAEWSSEEALAVVKAATGG